MKKTSSLFVFFFLLFSFSVASAYTSTDVQNATFLADENIIVKQSVESKYRLDDTITRAEVVGMALKIKWTILSDNYSCKNYFSDVKYDAKNNWICRAIELAADGGIISRSNTKARPQDTITKSEALAIMMKAAGISTDLTEEQKISIQSYRLLFENDISWQQNTIMSAMFHKIINNVTIDTHQSWSEWATGSSTALKVTFQQNKVATRAEVFGFAKQVLTFSKNQWGVSIVHNDVVVDQVKLTYDGTSTDYCEQGDLMIKYEIWDTIPAATLIVRTESLCELTVNKMDFYLYTQKGWLISLKEFIKKKYNVDLPSSWLWRPLKIEGSYLVIQAQYRDNLVDENVSYDTLYFTQKQMTDLEIEIIRKPSDTDLRWMFRWNIDIASIK